MFPISQNLMILRFGECVMCLICYTNLYKLVINTFFMFVVLDHDKVNYDHPRSVFSREDLLKLPDPVSELIRCAEFVIGSDYCLESQVGGWFIDEKYQDLTVMPQPKNGELEDANFLLWMRLKTGDGGYQFATRKELLNSYFQSAMIHPNMKQWLIKDLRDTRFREHFVDFLRTFPIYGLEVSIGGSMWEESEVSTRFKEQLKQSRLWDKFKRRTKVGSSSYKDYGAGTVLYYPVCEEEQVDEVKLD